MFIHYKRIKILCPGRDIWVAKILEVYNIFRLRPAPGFSDDNDYLKNTVAEEAHLVFFGVLPEEKVILAGGTDATDLVREAEQWLIEHSF